MGQNQDCVRMVTDGSWDDRLCNESRYILCNKYPLSTSFLSIPVTKNWSEAETFCDNEIGTHLASIHNADQNEEVSDLCGVDRCWIGLNDIVSERGSSKDGWVWTDGS